MFEGLERLDYLYLPVICHPPLLRCITTTTTTTTTRMTRTATPTPTPTPMSTPSISPDPPTLSSIVCTVALTETNHEQTIMLSHILYIARVHLTLISTWTTDLYNSWRRGLGIDNRHLDLEFLGSNPDSFMLGPCERVFICNSSPHSCVK